MKRYDFVRSVATLAASTLAAAGRMSQRE